MNKIKHFVHIPKNGGLTIRYSPFLKDRMIVSTSMTHKSAEYTSGLLAKMQETGDHPGIEHARWRDINPQLTEKYQSFAIIRNPWDRVVSRYFFAKKVIEVEKKESSSYADISSFEAFLEERHKWGNQEYMWHRAIRGWYPATNHVTDDFGILKCDMLSFENYNNDVCDYFNLKEMSRARNVTALNKGSYKDLYNGRTIQIIADWYKSDIDMFGYDFDSGPTKNTWRHTRELFERTIR